MSAIKFIFVCFLLFPQILWSSPLAQSTTLAGQARIRFESKNNADYNDRVSDQKDYTVSRFRFNLNFSPKNSDWNVFFQPQFTKTWGGSENIAGDSNTTSSQQTSGTLYDSGLDVHQAYFRWMPLEKLYIQLGRQEYNYGDQLVVGGVDWHNVGRSFDSARVGYFFWEKNFVEFFYSKIIDENNGSFQDGDFDFIGFYVSNNFGNFFKEVDFYLFDKADHRGQNNDIYTFGGRAKSKIQFVDYRFEVNRQKGRQVGNQKRSDEGLYDIELGVTATYWDTRFSLEYFHASQDYDQLYPTAHKWLGFADQFSRRNIKGYVFHFSTQPLEKFTAKIDYHIFKRVKNNQGAYNFSGATLGTQGSSDDIGDEWDLTIIYRYSETMKLAAGHSLVGPGTYLKAQNTGQKDHTQFSYVQLLANF